MTATFNQARDEIFALIKTAWETTGFNMVWPDKPNTKPSGRTPWARTTLRHSTGQQATIASFSGVSRWFREGVLTIQIFTPSGEGLSRAYDLAKVISDALEGVSTSCGVWFRNTRLNEVGPDGDWFQINVMTDFNYDEIK
jgi:hypothetical protein